MIRKRAFSLLPRVFSFLRTKCSSSRRRARALRLEPCETRNLLSAVSGTVYDDLTNDGFTPDDVPAGGVLVDLFQDNGNGFLDQPGDVLLDTQSTDPTTGSYTFPNLTEGRYHLRQRVPIGSRHSAGPDYYTFDVTGETVGLLIDTFESPDPAAVYFISAFDLDPMHLETDDARILGGQRDLLVDVLGDANAISASGMIGSHSGADDFQFASSSPGAKAILQYDGVDSDIEGPPAELVSGSFSSPIDLTADGTNTGLKIDFDMIQVGEGLNLLSVDVRVESVGGSATFLGMIPEFTTSTGYSIPFTSFAATGDFSFAELTSLEIIFNEEGVAAVDFQIDSIQAENPNGEGFDFANFTPTAAVGGVKYDDLTGNGLTDDDLPLGGVTIDLFLDNGDGIFEEANDTWLRDATTDALTGSYSFEGLADATYHIREQIPAGTIRTFGPDAYTFDVVGGAVGLLVDNFSDPNPNQSYFINAFDSDPLHIETEGSDILGGQRDLLVDVLGEANFVSASGSIGFQNGVGEYQFASAAPGTMAVLQYDGLDVDDLPGELEIGRMMPAVDLTANGLNTGLRIDMNMVQVGEQRDEMDVTVYVASSDGTASFVGTIPESVDRIAHFIPFSAFAGTPEFSFTEVTSLEFRLNPSGVADVDFQLDSILAENPDAAGFDFANFTVLPNIDIEKSTNGADADDPTGPVVPVGAPIVWTYVVANTGNVALSNITVTDSQGVVVTPTGGDTDGDDLLDLNEIWIYEASGTSLLGQYSNIGNVVGTPVLDSGEPIEGFDDVDDSDPSHYFGATTGITIEKYTDGRDADSPTGPILIPGDPVTWLYVINNTGNIPLTDISVTDDQGAIPAYIEGDFNGNDLLDPTEIWTFEAEGIVVVGQYANLGTVVGTPVDSDGELIEGFDDVADSDPSHYLAVEGGIHLEKATNGQDADNPRGQMIPVGESVIWTYTVSNTGNVALRDIDLTDDQGVMPDLVAGDINGNQLLDTNEIWIYEADGIALTGQYANLGSVIGTPAFDDGEPIEGLDPVNDADPSHYFGVDAGIHIEKATNGHDADTPTGPMIPAGDAVTWNYTVTNTGNVALWDVTVTDDQGVVPVFVAGDVNGNQLLDTGEIWIYEADGAAVAGQYANVGIVIGTPVGVDNEPIEGFEPVSDTDPSHYFGVLTSIHIEKATNGQDADAPIGPMVPAGDAITWLYTVSNTGNVPLLDVDVTDDQGVTPLFSGGDTNANQLLDTNEIWTYEADGIALAGQYANVGSVTGTPAGVDDEPIEGMEPVSDSDPSHYFGVTAGIHIEKATNGQDADAPTGPVVPAGDAITWLYTVSNTGNVALRDIGLTDDQGVVPVFVDGDVNANQLLDTNEIWTYSADGVAQAGQYANVGSVTGTPAGVDSEPIEGMEPVSDTDPSHYFGATAGIDIEKATNGDDADTPTGPMVPVGDAITWVYTVSNTGNVSLSDVTIADDQGVTPVFADGDTNANDLLDVGEIWTYEAAGTATADQYANVGTVTGIPVDVDGELIDVLDPVSDTDPSHYFGVTAGIHIEKATNGDDADTPTGPTVIYGDTVTWGYVVTNLGNVPLMDVVPVDDAGTPGDPSDDFVPTFVDGDVNGDNLLDIDETWSYTASITSTQLGQYANLAQVVGMPVSNGEPIPGMEDVWDDDPSHFFGQGLSSLSGYVYVDSNDNGWIDFNEVMLENAVITLVGTDVLGNNVSEQTTTDANGLYLFDDLVSGTYTISEMQPWAYNDGIDSIGSPGGVTADDEFSNIILPPNFDGVANNFGERGLRTPIVVKNMLVWPLNAWRNVYDGSPDDPAAEVQTNNETEVAPAPIAPVPIAPAPLLAAEDEALSDSDAGLTQVDLQPIVTEVIARWDDMEIDVDFSDVDFVITDLDDSLLGLTDGDTIYLDDDAAGQGWFVDQTPDRDEEFSDSSVDPRVVDRVDLLAVVARQLGETLDLKDLDAAIEMLLKDRLREETPDQPSVAEVNMAFFRLM